MPKEDWKKDLLFKYQNDRFFKEIFNEKEYQIIKRIGTIVDVGACAGEFSFWLYDEADKIYAIEPDPEEYKELEANIQEFGLDKVIPFNIALSDHNGEQELSEGGRGGHTLIGEKVATSKTVKTQTLTTFVTESNIETIDLLKIDIEDGERLVFGSNDFPEITPRIKKIVGEHLHCENILLNCGFKISKFDHLWLAERN